MAGIQKSLRLPPETLREIEQMAKETGRDFSGVTLDLLSEAIKTRRCPGIVLAEGVSGRRAKVAGTGIEVWEILANYSNVSRGRRQKEKADGLIPCVLEAEENAKPNGTELRRH